MSGMRKVQKGRATDRGQDCKMPFVCPLLVPLDASGNRFDGLLSVYGNEFRLNIFLPESGKLEHCIFEGDLQLAKVLKNFNISLEQRLRESTSLSSFLMELQAILENKLHSESQVMFVKPPKYYSKLIEDIDVLGWQRLSFIDPMLHEIHLTIEDEHHRQHLVKLEFPPEYPTKPPVVKIDLPRPFDLLWTNDKTLVDVCKQVEVSLGNFQTIWNLLDEVDRELWILEPEKPLRSDVMRRIALGKGSSLSFTINLNNPRSKPTWQILGSDQVAGPLLEKLTTSFRDWDVEKGCVENWRSVLGVELPSPMSTTVEEIQEDCGICYCFKLGEYVPDVVCSETRCGKSFHSVCLVEWLRSQSTSRQSFNMFFGECPFCSKGISCRDPNLR